MITAVIINYNQAKYLSQCIESFLAQKYLKEIIVVDDCSTDNSKEIADKYNVRWFQTSKNTGDPAKPINIAIKNVDTEYFYLLASDDWVSDMCFEILHPRMENLDYIGSSLHVTDEAGKIGEIWNNSRKTPEDIVNHVFNTGGSGIMSTVGLYRTSFMKKIGYIKRNIESDTLNVLNYLKNGLRYDIVSTPLFYYRQHSENISKNIEKRVLSTIEIMNFIHENFNEEDFCRQIIWEKINNKKEFMLLYMGRVYINLFNNYSEIFIPPYLRNTLNKKEMQEITKPFIFQAQKFLKKAFLIKDEFINEVEASLKEVDHLIETVTEQPVDL